MKKLSKIKEQIDQTQDLSNIITTMKNISVVNTTHYERQLRAVRQYFSTVEQGFQIFLQNHSEKILEQLEKKNHHTPRPIAAIVIGSEKGLCGEFNEKIRQFFDQQIRDRDVFATLAIGYKISTKLQQKSHKVFEFPTSHEEILDLLKTIIMDIRNWLDKRQIGEVIFYHHQLRTGLQYEPTSKLIFPLNLDWLKKLKDKPWPSHCLPTYTMNEEEFFYDLTQEFLFISMYRSFVESLASENASRLSSMQTAEENIQDRLTELQNQYNLQRQTEITEELSDIISGFEALQKKKRL